MQNDPGIARRTFDRHSGTPRSGGPGIHTPQRWGYGFRVRGLKAAPRNDERMIRSCNDRAPRAPQRACRSGLVKACATVCGRRPPITWATHPWSALRVTMQSLPTPPLQLVAQP